MTWLSRFFPAPKSSVAARRRFQPQLETLGQRLLPSTTPVVLLDDHGNSVAQATSIGPSTQVSGNIDMSGDKDYFKFRAVAGVQYNIEAKLGTLTDSTLALVNNAGKQLAYNDDRSSGDRSSYISWKAPADGDFFLLAKGYGSRKGSYAVKVTPIDDHGNSAAAATSLKLNKAFAGKIEQPYDSDWYKFSAVPGMTYVLETKVGSVADTMLALYDSSSKQLAFDDDSGEGNASRIHWTAQKEGVYYLKVTGFGARMGAYSVTVHTIVSRPIVPLGGTTNSTKPKFTWTAGYNAAYYQIEIVDLNTGVKVVSQTKIKGASYTPKVELEAGHIYTYQVRAYTATGIASSWSGSTSIRVESTNIAKPVLVGPLNSIDTLRPTFTWKAVAKAKHYEISILDRTTGRYIVPSAVVRGLSYWSVSLPEGHSFRWWVRAVSQTNTPGDWASMDCKTVGKPVLNPVWYMNDASGNLNYHGETFTWSKVIGASRYEVWVNDVTAGTSAVKWTDNVKGESVSFAFTDAELASGHTYAVWVRAFSDAHVDGDWSEKIEFQLGEPQGEWETFDAPTSIDINIVP